jgi:sodium/proline symporter
MSTAAAQLLMTASVFSNDFYPLVKGVNAIKQLRLARIAVVLIAVVGFVIALNPASSIMLLVSDAWAGLGSAFSPLVLLALYWKRTSRSGAIAGIITGSTVVIIWDFVPLGGETLAKITELYSLVPGFALSLLSIVLFSVFSKTKLKKSA